MKINSINASKILNSNSNYTVQVKIETTSGIFHGSSPAGESTSQYEVRQFNDDIDKEIKKFDQFIQRLRGKTFSKIEELYDFEKTLPEEFIGGPSLSLSYAILYALSNDAKKEPYSFFGGKSITLPISKMLGGGMHASNLGMDIQEILVTTIDNDVSKSIDGTISVYKELKDILKNSTYSFLGGVDPEGGFVTGLDNYESLKLVKKAVEKTIRKTGLDIRIGIDMAASTFYKDGRYVYKKPFYGKKEVSCGEQIDLVKNLIQEFDLYYIEDPVDETRIEDYGEILKDMNVLVVGDDVTATRTDRLEKSRGNINSVLIKPNQVGSLNAVKAFSDAADKIGMVKIVSHRSEETCIPIITDIAIGLGAKYLKVGINRGERVEKINRLLEVYGI
jgi:enolase